MAQLLSFRALIGFVSIAVAMVALFGASPLKAFSSTLQRAGLNWLNPLEDATVPLTKRPNTKTPVYFFSHGGVSLYSNGYWE
jgi:4,5-DOPA dioxygenase extradiol